MENVPWEVDFDWSADRSGQITVGFIFEVQTAAGPFPSGVLSVPVLVTRGMTPEQKAAEVVRRLRADLSDLLDITYDGGDDFKVQVKANPRPPYQNFRAITDFRKNDGNTGEGVTGVRDDPGRRIPKMTAYFGLVGRGERAKGIAQLQLGTEQPLVSVRTGDKTATAVINALIRAFNRAYREFGFTAKPAKRGGRSTRRDSAGLTISGVPCPLGLRAGTRDPGFGVEIGFGTTRV